MLLEFRVSNSSFRSVVIEYTCQRQWAMGDLIACGMCWVGNVVMKDLLFKIGFKSNCCLK